MKFNKRGESEGLGYGFLIGVAIMLILLIVAIFFIIPRLTSISNPENNLGIDDMNLNTRDSSNDNRDEIIIPEQNTAEQNQDNQNNQVNQDSQNNQESQDNSNT